MLQITKRGAEVAGEARRRGDVDPELREAHVGRHVQRLEGLLAHHAVDGDAVARLEAAHRRLDVGIEDVAGAGRRVEVADRASAAGAAAITLAWRLPSRSRSIGGTFGQPPRATIAS